MLVLARQLDEIIRIGDDIFVQVVDIRGDKVRLGVTAPRSISVHREEIYQKIRDERPPLDPRAAKVIDDIRILLRTLPIDIQAEAIINLKPVEQKTDSYTANPKHR